MSERRVAGGARVAIVGSGFGGLAAAIRLQAAGLRTVLFEARDRPGGRAYVYQDGGFTFDAGPTVITAPPCLDELFELAGERREDHLTLLPVNPFYRLSWVDGSTLDYEGDAQKMRAEIARLAPGDADGFERFLEYSGKLFRAGYEELVAEPFLRFTDMVRAAPDLLRLRADRSVYGAVSRFVKDERLRQAMSFHALLIGGNPFETSALYALIPYLERKWGVFFPRGGTGALVQALAALYARLGGELRLSTPVSRIELEPGGRHRVITAAGGERFDAVVSNADLHHTYARLYGGTPAGEARAAALSRRQWSTSLFVIYFGTRRTWPGMAHHTVLFGPRYRQLLQEIFHGPDLPPDFSLYLHAPVVTDPGLAPPGCGAYYVLSPVPHLGNAPVDWPRQGEAYADRVLAELEARMMPGLRAEIVTRRLFTPVDFQQQLGAFQGNAFSLAPSLGQSAYFRPHNRDPYIPGLYLVGAGTHPGAGVPGVINSAKATARLVLEDLRPSEVLAS
jgi:phytoene desaturase